MAEPNLIPFWIHGPDPKGPLGYGVTAYSLQDALDIIRRIGYQLPDDNNTLQVQANIVPADIEHSYVREHMGPIVNRGLWYPFIDVGYGA